MGGIPSINRLAQRYKGGGAGITDIRLIYGLFENFVQFLESRVIFTLATLGWIFVVDVSSVMNCGTPFTSTKGKIYRISTLGSEYSVSYAFVRRNNVIIA